jgi:hypothetical protein
MTRSGSRMLAMVEGEEALAPQAVDEVLHVAPLDLRELPGSERRNDVRAQ